MNVNELTETISEYGKFCKSNATAVKTGKIYPNNKVWVSKECLNEKESRIYYW